MNKTNLFKSFMVTVVCALVVLGANVATVYAAESESYFVDLGYEYDLYTCGIVDFDSREIKESGYNPEIVISFEVPENGTISISDSLDEILICGSDGVFRNVNSEMDIPVVAGEYNIYSYLKWSYYYDHQDEDKKYENFIINFTPSNVEVEANDLFDSATELNGKMYGLISPVFDRKTMMSNIGRYDKIDTDVDNYHFDITTPSKVMVSIETESSSMLCAQIYSEDEDGNIELIKDAKANQYNNLPIGSYFVRVYEDKSYRATNISYEIELVSSEVSGNIESENNNTEKTANEIIANEIYTGSISSKKDKDYFAITFDEDTEVTFVTKVPREKAKKLYSFSVMRKDSKGNLVNIISYKSTANPSIKKTFSAKAGTTYYLMVESGNKKYNSDIDYEFTFEVEVKEPEPEVVVEDNDEGIESIIEADLEIELGDTVKLPKFKGQKNVISINESIVSIANGNKFTGNSLGTTIIVFLDKNGNAIQSYTVAVVEPEC